MCVEDEDDFPLESGPHLPFDIRLCHGLLMRLADFRGALKVAEQSRSFAETGKDPAGLLIADFMLGGAFPAPVVSKLAQKF